MMQAEVLMSSYLSVTGILTQIQPLAGNDGAAYGCTLALSVRTQNSQEVQFTMNGDTYVVDNVPFNPGDRVTVFYDTDAPAQLIYPPRYQAVAAATASYYQYYLGEFYNSLVSTDGTLQLNGNVPLNAFLPNGQIFSGALAGKVLLVEYAASTRSIPAQVTPSRLFVFCRA